MDSSNMVSANRLSKVPSRNKVSINIREVKNGFIVSYDNRDWKHEEVICTDAYAVSNAVLDFLTDNGK